MRRDAIGNCQDESITDKRELSGQAQAATAVRDAPVGVFRNPLVAEDDR
jgi:hypothetical protein